VFRLSPYFLHMALIEYVSAAAAVAKDRNLRDFRGFVSGQNDFPTMATPETPDGVPFRPFDRSTRVCYNSAIITWREKAVMPKLRRFECGKKSWQQSFRS